MFFGSNPVCAFQFDTMSVHFSGFKSMNIVYVPGAMVLPLMAIGTSVFSCVVSLAPARQTGASGFTAFPYFSPSPREQSRARA